MKRITSSDGQVTDNNGFVGCYSANGDAIFTANCVALTGDAPEAGDKVPEGAVVPFALKTVEVSAGVLYLIKKVRS